MSPAHRSLTCSVTDIEVDADTCDLAATVGEQTGARTLDVVHPGPRFGWEPPSPS